jgi:hypothetical protein
MRVAPGMHSPQPSSVSPLQSSSTALPQVSIAAGVRSPTQPAFHTREAPQVCVPNRHAPIPSVPSLPV